MALKNANQGRGLTLISASVPHQGCRKCFKPTHWVGLVEFRINSCRTASGESHLDIVINLGGYFVPRLSGSRIQRNAAVNQCIDKMVYLSQIRLLTFRITMSRLLRLQCELQAMFVGQDIVELLEKHKNAIIVIVLRYIAIFGSRRVYIYSRSGDSNDNDTRQKGLGQKWNSQQASRVRICGIAAVTSVCHDRQNCFKLAVLCVDSSSSFSKRHRIGISCLSSTAGMSCLILP